MSIHHEGRYPAERSASAGSTEEARRFQFGWRAVLLTFAFWTFFAVLNAANRLFDRFQPWGPDRQLAEAVLPFLDAYLWAIATPLIFWLAWRFGMDQGRWRTRAAILLGAGVLIAALMVLADLFAWSQLMDLPRGRGVPPGMGRGPRGASSVRVIFLRPFVLVDLMTYFGILAAGFAREYFLRYQARQQETVRLQAHGAQLQAQLAEARLDALRHQLNPHFLFNTLNAVSALVARDPKAVRRMISRLSDLLRYALEGPKQQEIPLDEELRLLRLYLEILEIRFQGRLETRVVAEPGLEHALVPTLILQPLAENAMTHGVSRAGGHGRIEVHARRDGRQLVLSVADTGGGGGPDDDADSEPLEQGTGVGLRNTRARLEELYGADQRLELRPGAEGGMVAEIRLPLHFREDAPESSDAVRPEGAVRV